MLQRIEGLGQTALARRVSLTDSDAVAEFVTVVKGRFGNIQTFVHAAGPIVPQIHLSKVEPARLQAHLNEDVMGFFPL